VCGFLLPLHQGFLQSLDVILLCLIGQSLIGLKNNCEKKKKRPNLNVKDNSYLASDVSFEIILVSHIGLKAAQATRLFGSHGCFK